MALKDIVEYQEFEDIPVYIQIKRRDIKDYRDSETDEPLVNIRVDALWKAGRDKHKALCQKTYELKGLKEEQILKRNLYPLIKTEYHPDAEDIFEPGQKK
jgi:hypothetical protein